MKQNFDIRLLRFKNGEDIISIVEERKTEIKLIHPLAFNFDIDTEENTHSLYWDAWIPIYIMKTPEVTLKKSEFMWILNEDHISEEFIESYLDFIGIQEEKENEFKEHNNVVSIKDAKPRLH